MSGAETNALTSLLGTDGVTVIGILVADIVAIYYVLKTQSFVPGWAYQALEKRLAEAEERENRALKIGERLIEIQLRTMESAPARREA